MRKEFKEELPFWAEDMQNLGTFLSMLKFKRRITLKHQNEVVFYD